MDESDTAYELPLGSRKTSLYTHSYLNFGQVRENFWGLGCMVPFWESSDSMVLGLRVVRLSKDLPLHSLLPQLRSGACPDL